MSSQGLKHAIHTRHKYWHEHAHHDTRHEETRLEDTTWLSSDALKEDEEKEVKIKREKKSLENTVASGMRGGGLSAQEGSLVRSCMFGSIQYVHVVNMKAGILYAQQKQLQWRNQWACFLFSIMKPTVRGWLHVNETKTQWESKCDRVWWHISIFYIKGIHHKKLNGRRSDYTYAQEYKGEVQRVIEETRHHVSKWRFYPLRGSSTHFDKVVKDLLNFGWFPFLNPSVCRKIE